MTETSTELVLIDAQNAVEIFTKGGMKAILDGIELKVRAIPLDPSTATGREEIRSTAYRVARTKVALDNEGKKLTEGWREATKRVNEERRIAVERLDALGEEVRKPLTDFENKERLRVEAHEEALKDITGMHAMIAAYPDMTVALLEEHLSDLEKSNPGREWEEFSARAKAARDDCRAYITRRIAERKKFDADQAELERLRKEEADRIQRERDERLKAEAAEKARLEAERKAKEEADLERQRVLEVARRVQEENDRQKREAEAKAKAEQERLAAEARAIEEKRLAEERAKLAAEQRARDAEAARIAAEKKAEADKKAAEEKAAADLKAAREKAKRDAEAAAQREREKIERERKAAEDARLKREADQKRRDKVRSEITDDLYTYGMFDADFPDRLHAAVDAIMEGKIRNVKVVF